MQRHHVLVATRGVDDRVEIDKRVVLGRVLVTGPRDFRGVGAAEFRVADFCNGVAEATPALP
jgi:hypothetical protein